jgi:hypothetical protein
MTPRATVSMSKWDLFWSPAAKQQVDGASYSA